MKKSLSVIFLFLLFVGCKKNNDALDDTNDNNNITNPVDSTNTNQPSAVNTSLRVFDMSTGSDLTLSFVYGFQYFTRMKSYYNALDNITADKYLTPLKMVHSLYTQNSALDDLYKLFPASNAIMNYVNSAPIALQGIGNLPMPSSSGTFAVPGGNAELSFSPFSFGQLNGGGSTDIRAWYTNPEMDEYAVSLPVNLTVDQNNNKKFLQSYGVCYFALWNFSNLQNQVQIAADAEVWLRMPILTSMQAGAPDSIPAWNIDPTSHLWVQNGYAAKSGNFYEKKVFKKGFWNFAVPQNGNYIKIKLRSDSSSTLINNAIVIKDDTNKQVAEAVTDANGDALFFVPSNRNLTMYTKIVSDYTVLTQNIGSFNSYTETPVNIPISKSGLSTLFGKVFDCSGNPILNGYVKFVAPQVYFPVYPFGGYTEFHIPITNGNFVTSFLNDGIGLYGTVKIYDPQGNIIGDSTKISIPGSNPYGANPGEQINYNLYSCWNSTKLFINYEIDGVKYSLTDDATNPNCFLLKTSPTPSRTQILATQGNLGVSYVHMNGATFSYDIVANGVNYQNDNSGLGYQAFLRNDGVVGGYYEGIFNLYCRDAANVMHNIKGNYRLKLN